jgi:multidrug efflux pump subunit AcrA (membrane-fusion protein)
MKPYFEKIKYFFFHHKILVISSSLVVVLLSILTIYTVQKNKIEYVKPRNGEIIEAIYGLGKVKTDHFYEVKLGVSSTVIKVFVKEGVFVKKGDLLIRLEDGVDFYAPFAGTITEVNVSDRQIVFPQQAILRLEDFLSKYIEVSLEQQGALRVKPGQSVKVVFESIRGDVQQGRVSTIFSRNDEFLAHILVPGLSENILPGMTADIAIEIDRKANALLIPLMSINNGRVVIERDGKKMPLLLKIGSIDGNWAEVTEGDLKITDLIVVKGKP